MKGHFTGRYKLVPIPKAECKKRGLPCHWWSRPLFDFILDPDDPLTYHRGEFQAQPCKSFVTDGGSIPNLVQVIPAFDRFRYPASYGFHDSAYKKHCWWTRLKGDDRFHKTPMTCNGANLWLKEMLESEGAWPATAETVYFAVQGFGWMSW